MVCFRNPSRLRLDKSLSCIVGFLFLRPFPQLLSFASNPFIRTKHLVRRVGRTGIRRKPLEVCSSSVSLVTRQTPPRTTAKNNRQDQPFPSPTKPDGISVREVRCWTLPNRNQRAILFRIRQSDYRFVGLPRRAGRNQRPGVRGLCTPHADTHAAVLPSSVSLVTRQTPPRTTAKNNRQDQPFPSPPRRSRTESASGSPRSVHTPANTHAACASSVIACHSADTAKNNLHLPPRPVAKSPRQIPRNLASESEYRQLEQDARSQLHLLGTSSLGRPPRTTSKNNVTSLFPYASPLLPNTDVFLPFLPDGIFHGIRPDRAFRGRRETPGVRAKPHARSRTAPPRSRLSLGRHRQEQPPRTTAKNNLHQPFPSPPRQSRTESASGSPSVCAHPSKHARSRTAPPRSPLVTRQTPPRTTSKNNRQDQPFPSPPRQSRTESASGSPRSVHTPANTHAAVLRLLGLACHSADTAKNNLQEQPPRPAFSKSAQTEAGRNQRPGVRVSVTHPNRKHARSRTAPPRSRLSLGRHRQEQPPRTTSKTSLFQVRPDRAGRNQRPGVRGLCTPQQTRTQPYCASMQRIARHKSVPKRPKNKLTLRSKDLQQIHEKRDEASVQVESSVNGLAGSGFSTIAFQIQILGRLRSPRGNPRKEQDNHHGKK